VNTVKRQQPKLWRVASRTSFWAFAILVCWQLWPQIYDQFETVKLAKDGSSTYFSAHKEAAYHTVELCGTHEGREQVLSFFCSWVGANLPEKCSQEYRAGYGVEICRNAATAKWKFEEETLPIQGYRYGI